MFFQLFPLLLDCLTFGFSYSPLLHLCYAEQLSVMPLSWAATKKKGKLCGSNYVKAFYLGFIIQGQFSGWQLFWGNYQRSFILRKRLGTDFFRGNYPGGNYPGGYCPGGDCSGGNGEQLSRGQLSSIVLLCGVWKYQKIIIWHHIIYHLTCCPKLQTRKILTSHFFSFFLFQNLKRGFQFFNMQPLKNILQRYVFWERFCGIKLFLNCGKSRW